MVSENSPLLAPEEGSICSTIDDTHSRFSVESRAIKNFLKRRFWWLCILGVAAIITLQLSFLPRTSPNRDFRRWHNLHFTRSDIKRVFLVQLLPGRKDDDGHTLEDNLHAWLRQFSAVNSKAASAIGSPSIASEISFQPSQESIQLSGSSALASFVEKLMRSMKYLPVSHSYRILQKLQTPVSLSLKLVDSKTSRVLFTASLQELNSATPAYFLFSQNGTLNASFVYASFGTPKDFTLLSENDIILKNKIVIFEHPLVSEYQLHDKVQLAESHGCAGVIVVGDSEVDSAISRNFKPLLPPNCKFRLPISHKDALPILQTLPAPKGPFSKWKFSPTLKGDSLELLLASNFLLLALNATNIVAEITGALFDSEIIIGASRDVLTSANPSSGHAILLELMRRFQYLQRLGWKPLRTIRFISWDGSRSGGLGSLENVKDDEVFKKNLPIMAYINLDGDVVTGSHLSVNSNPLFNHVLRSCSKLIPFPKNMTLIKSHRSDQKSVPFMDFLSLLKLEDDEVLSFDEDEDDETSLHHFWFKQDKAWINNKLGLYLAGKDLATFQLLLGSPIVDVKFIPSARYNDSLYVPESNAYSLKWVEDEMDPNFILHGLLVRLLGLLVLSLGEHEVVDSRVEVYFERAREYFSELAATYGGLISKWGLVRISGEPLKKSQLVKDFQERTGHTYDALDFKHIWKQFEWLLEATEKQAHVFDNYNQEVEDLWTTDYPWYKMIRKLHIYAKFKVTNFKMLRMERELGQLANDDLFDGSGSPVFRHFMYDLPQGAMKIKKKYLRSAFGKFYEAFDADSVEKVAHLLIARYDRLKSVYKRIM